MRKTFLTSLVALLCWACNESVSPATYNGIGSVEITDSLAAIHYYNRTFLFKEFPSHIGDSSRVIFMAEATSRANDTTETFYAKVKRISPDIRRNIIFNMEATKSFGKEAGIMVRDLHLTRDFRRLDFFNITTSFATTQNNNDKVRLVLEQRDIANKEATLWIKHWQSNSDTLNAIGHDTMSVPMNTLISDENSERLLLHIKWIESSGDTITEDYTYSYFNNL